VCLVAIGKEYNKLLWKCVVGSVDFRICNGRSERKRRPMVSWWADYIGQAAPKRIKPVPKESSLDLWVEWFRTAAGRRVLQLAEIMGITPHELFEQLIDGLKPAKSIVPATVEARALAQAQK